MPLHIAILSETTRRVPLAREPFWIGRDPGSDLCLWDLRVSRRHARISLAKGEYVISSEGRHGLHVNGNKVPFLALKDGDEILLTPPEQQNPIRLRFEHDLMGARPDVGVPLATAWIEREKERARGGDDVLGSYVLSGRCPVDPDAGALLVAREAKTGTLAFVKVWPAVASVDDADSFLRFACAVAGGPHPSLVPILEAGLFPAKDRVVRWMAMEEVTGRPASLRIAEGPQTPLTVVRRMRGLCGALHLLHARGVVHGNVVPGNVLLRPDGGATLSDLGRSFLMRDAKPLPPDRHPEPEYTAPEMLGEGRIASAPADVFGLAATGYGMLTGRAPFPPTPDRGPPPLLDGVGHWLPSGLSDALRRSLDPNPASRPTAEDLSQALAFADVSLSGRTA